MIILLGLEKTPLSVWLNKDSAEITAPIILFLALINSLWQMKKNSHVYFK